MRFNWTRANTKRSSFYTVQLIPYVGFSITKVNNILKPTYKCHIDAGWLFYYVLLEVSF